MSGDIEHKQMCLKRKPISYYQGICALILRAFALMGTGTCFLAQKRPTPFFARACVSQKSRNYVLLSIGLCAARRKIHRYVVDFEYIL